MINIIESNRELFNSLYRKGNFEEKIKFKFSEEFEDNILDIFYVSKKKRYINNVATKKEEIITIQEAILVYYEDLVNFGIDASANSLNTEQKLLIYKAKTLIYELTDYFLNTPTTLKDFFANQTKIISNVVSSNHIFEQYLIDEFGIKTNKKGFQEIIDDIEKTVLLGALFGMNAAYREHLNYLNFDALGKIEKILSFIENKYVENKRLISLVGLGNFLLGNLRRSTTDYTGAEEAYRRSLEFYCQRVIITDNQRVKELENKTDSKRETHLERERLALRRASLVSSIGLGHLYLITSKIEEAEKAILFARAVARQNCGRIYSTLIDLVYFSILRAKYSSSKERMQEVVSGLENCLTTFMNICPETNYRYRTHIELSLALHYQSLDKNDSEKVKIYNRIEELLQKSIVFFDTVNEYKTRNSRLLAEAYFVRSYMRRFNPNQNKSGSLEDAEKSCERAKDKAKQMEPDALISLASYYLAEASEISKKLNFNPDSEVFNKYFEFAKDSLKRALTLNESKNIRIEAVCLLKLAELYDLLPENRRLAFHYFNKFEEIESKIGHDFVKTGADKFRSLSIKNSFFISVFEESLNIKEKQDELVDYLTNLAISRFFKSLPSNINTKELNKKLVKHLSKQLGVSPAKAYNMIKEEKFKKILKKFI